MGGNHVKIASHILNTYTETVLVVDDLNFLFRQIYTDISRNIILLAAHVFSYINELYLI